jgi:triosephosphate isomerase
MKKIIIANWKMNPKNFKEAQALFDSIKKAKRGPENEVVICPPFVWLRSLALKNTAKGISFGAQNCHWEISGAYTGEVAAVMTADAGAKYVILGHSERRQFMGETNEIINLKIKTALKAGLKPILCVGEKAGEEMSSVLEEQLARATASLSVNQAKEIIVAYEPVWAIGTGNACSPDNALSAALFVKKTLTKLYSRFLADKILILYGGSVTSLNAIDYLDKAQMDGLLVGGASLNEKEFGKIIENLK